MEINETRKLGRAKNAVLSLFERRLSVPKIYMDAVWQSQHVDVLAINRDGSGDVHVALSCLRPTFEDESVRNVLGEHDGVEHTLGRLAELEAQYKYVVLVDSRFTWADQPFDISESLKERSFSPDGIGRVGFISVKPGREGELTAEVFIKPERFRAFVGTIADEFVQHHHADWEMRA